MTQEQKKSLLKAQQGELDAVLLYNKLADLVKDEGAREKLLKVAADEGKHASILKEYTGEILRPKSLKANFIAILYKVLGHNYVFNMLAKGELKSVVKYGELAKDFPNINEIIKDEKIHADIAESLKRN